MIMGVMNRKTIQDRSQHLQERVNKTDVERM